ncbi:unnamed protein product [Cuscuta campestris]|uniref:RING-type E3 ubiquitin transferase n=1 Tax=Cuscuta campestris TaxID=132261 RepID=A0A484MZS5_9ASTE|nr:unnamed protein product [Cuscuta campestris]
MSLHVGVVIFIHVFLQTYERESIQQWLDSNHTTCPKTGQSLPHLLLAPNFALKNIIQEWCDANNFPIPNSSNHHLDHECLSDSGNNARKSSPKNSRLQPLVDYLSSDLPEEQLKAVEEIRFLSKESAENRVSIAECGGIPPLVQLLTRPDSRIREHAVTALLNLSIDESNKRAISEERPIPAIIEILKTGTAGARENSAAALFSLSTLDENKEEIGFRDGIRPLIDLLEEGGVRGKKDAIAALFNVCIHRENKAAAVEAGIVDPLVRFLGEEELGGIVDEILSILLLLASHPAGRQEMGSLKFVETIVGIIGKGRSPKNKECAAAVLLELGMHNSNLMLAALQFGVYDPLMEVAQSGTDRAQRKAKSILHYMSKAEQIP